MQPPVELRSLKELMSLWQLPPSLAPLLRHTLVHMVLLTGVFWLGELA